MLLSDCRVLVGVAALALAACEAPPSSTTKATPKKVDAKAPIQTPAPSAPPTPQKASPDTQRPTLGSTRLYLLAGDSPRRLVRFDEAGAANLPTSLAIEHLFEGPDNGVYVHDAAALHRIAGDQLEEVVRFPAELGPVHHVVLGRDQSMWIVAGESIGERTGDTWKLTPLAELQLDHTTRLAFDSDQTLWAVAPKRALYREAGSWLPAPVELLATNFELRNPIGSPVGRVHVTNNYLITRIGKQDFDSVVIDAKTRVPYMADLDIAPDGYACSANASCQLACANAIPPTIIWRFPLKLQTYACDTVHELAVEASHRVWVASSSGLSLIMPDREVHEFSVAEYPALAGPITDMVAVE